MRALKLLLLALALSLPAWGLTNNGVSAPIQGVGVPNTDCPLAIANAGGSSNGGTNGKAVAIQLPTWASSADVDISGTFVATWILYVSTDGITYRNMNGLWYATMSSASTSASIGAVTINSVSSRFVCVVFSSYTSGTAVVAIEPRVGSAVVFPMLSNGVSGGGTAFNAGSNSALTQASANTSTASLMTVAAADKSVVHQPAAATAASASVTAVAAVRHIATSCNVMIAATAAQPAIVVNLRDGATGAGTVLWTCTLACAINTPCMCQSQPVNLLGSNNTAMTCETATAPAATNTAVATLTYHDAG